MSYFHLNKTMTFDNFSITMSLAATVSSLIM